MTKVNISYLSMTEEGGERRSVRQMELWRGYGFHCNCQACTLVASEFDNEEELRENLKQLQMVGAKNWDEIDASEYLEGISRLQGNMKHIMDVLAICFHASKDQVVYLRENIRYRPPPGTQTGIWGEMPYTGPLHLWPWITRGEQKSATLATTFLCSGGKLEGEVGGVATLEGMQPSPSYLNKLPPTYNFSMALPKIFHILCKTTFIEIQYNFCTCVRILLVRFPNSLGCELGERRSYSL